MKKWIFAIIGVAVTCFLLGMCTGRKSVKPLPAEKVIEVRWEKGEEIHDTIKVPVPYEVIVSEDVPVFIPTDTAKLFEIWSDYYLKRNYSLDFSNDTIGVFKVDASVSENKLLLATSTIIPNVKTVVEKEVVYKQPKLIAPWVIVGTSVDFKVNKLQTGVDIKDRFIVGVSGVRINDSYGYTIDVGYKFKNNK